MPERSTRARPAALLPDTGRERSGFDEALVRGLLARDADTIREVVDRFGPRLILVAYRYLNGKASRKVEAEEVVQSALGSFFRHDLAGRFEIGTWDELWSLLVVITRRKCRKQRRYWSAAKRSLPVPATAAGAAAGADPVEMAVMRELIDRTLGRFDERSRQIVELSLQGMDTATIAAELGRSERTVQRVRNGLKAFLRGELETTA
ncbi:hypothetical protein GC170_22060 [bacterium]|nr:hypothetical protein [bacterium]